jgi:hypothetical protein
MAIEIIPKPAEKVPFWQNFLFYFSFVLLISSALGYFALGRFIARERVVLGELDEVLTRERTAEETALENRVFDYQKKIEDFSQLINEHLYSSKIFPFFENISHPKVWFSKFGLDFTSYELVVLGEAESFSALSQQIQILEKEPLIKGVSLSGLSIGREGIVEFAISFYLDSKIFK